MGVPEGESKSEVEPKLGEQKDEMNIDQGEKTKTDNIVINEDEPIMDKKKEID